MRRFVPADLRICPMARPVEGRQGLGVRCTGLYMDPWHMQYQLMATYSYPRLALADSWPYDLSASSNPKRRYHAYPSDDNSSPRNHREKMYIVGYIIGMWCLYEWRSVR